MGWPQYDNAGVEQISAPQLFTAAWANLGPKVSTRGMGLCAFWLNFDINGGANLRFRVQGFHSNTSSPFLLPIKVVGSSVVNVEDLYYELTDDADQRLVLSVQLDDVVPFIQPQIEAGTVGTAALAAAFYTRGGGR